MLPATWLKTAEQLCRALAQEAARYGADPLPPIVPATCDECRFVPDASRTCSRTSKSGCELLAVPLS